jgi:hypothetical protein
MDTVNKAQACHVLMVATVSGDSALVVESWHRWR